MSKTLFYIIGNYATALWKTNKNCKAILGELAAGPTLFYEHPHAEEKAAMRRKGSAAGRGG